MRRFGATFEWRPFDLHPEYPPEGVDRGWIERRYGPGYEAGVEKMIEAAGLPVTTGMEKIPNGTNGLVIAQMALDQGRLDDLLDPVFRAYWAEGRDISEPDVLVPLAAEAGLDPDDARDAIHETRRFDAVQRSTTEALEVGVTGVPAWVADDRVLIPGAQPHEVFERIFVKLGHEPVEGSDPPPPLTLA